MGVKDDASPDSWARIERLVALVVVALAFTRIRLMFAITVGDLVAYALIPVWLARLRRYRAAVLLGVLIVLAGAVGALLSAINAVDHQVSTTLLRYRLLYFSGLAARLGLLLWARSVLSVPVLIVAAGVGMFAAPADSASLFAENPWKFRFAVPTSVVLLGLASATRRRLPVLASIAVLVAVSALNDARSYMSILILVAALLIWHWRPRANPERGWQRVPLALAALGSFVYFALQALMLEGALGTAIEERSQQQIQSGGSLLAGGRPEFGASLALVRHFPAGFGLGTSLNRDELTVAKQGMSLLNYDPNNGYVYSYMFGRGIELHSSVADLWAWCGWVGVLLAAAILAVLLRGASQWLRADPYLGAVPVLMSVLTLWNLFFSPFLASLTPLLMALTFAHTPARRVADGNDSGDTEQAPQRATLTART